VAFAVQQVLEIFGMAAALMRRPGDPVAARVALVADSV
jgi:hypothetical protein